MKVILDTNILVSTLLSKTMRARLARVFTDPRMTIVVNYELLAEFQQVLQRPKIKKHLSDEQIQTFLTFLQRRVEIIEMTSNVEFCRDPKDDYLLALCKESQADYLISGDQDLLVLEEFEQTKILPLSKFLALLS